MLVEIECPASVKSEILGVVIGLGVEPEYIGEAAKPGSLSLGELAGVDFDGLDGVGQVGLAGEVSDNFLISKGLAGLEGDSAGGG
ncbi:unnamed protein product [marine sediment metagenome]|uniref:Uncharacterized protein n=1 Tax=marine sediment metagenome TaxID=412755 RepID=X0V4S2_9ZZZZ